MTRRKKGRGLLLLSKVLKTLADPFNKHKVEGPQKKKLKRQRLLKLKNLPGHLRIMKARSLSMLLVRNHRIFVLRCTLVLQTSNWTKGSVLWR